MRKEIFIEKPPLFQYAVLGIIGRRSFRVCKDGLTYFFKCRWNQRTIKRYIVIEDHPSEGSYKIKMNNSGGIRIYTNRNPEGEALNLYTETRRYLIRLLKKHKTLYVSMEIEE